MSEAKNALSRWSQRKAAARRGESDDEPAVPASETEAAAESAAVPAPEPAASPAESEPPVLPPIEELDAQSDYTVFLGKDVPEALRSAALRKLWASDPVFSVLDGLNDYDDDYTQIADIINLAQTSFRPAPGDEVEKKIDAAFGNTEADARAAADSHGDQPRQSDAASENVAGENAAAADAPVDATPQASTDTTDPAATQPAKASSK